VSRTLAVLLLAAAGCTWGATFPVVKAALADSGPLTFLALRFALASLLLMPLLRWRGGVPAWRAVTCGLALLVGYVLQTVGLTTTTPARSAFITALSAVLVPAIEPVFGLGRATRRVWCGACVALLGLAVLLRPDAGSLSMGDLLTVGCAVVFAFHVLLLQWTVRAVPINRATTVQVFTTAALAIPLAGLEGCRVVPTARLAIAVLVCAVLATVAAFWVMTAVQRVLSAAATAVVLTLEPVAAAVTSLLMGEDVLSLAMVAGGVLVVGGVVLATATPRQKPH